MFAKSKGGMKYVLVIAACISSISCGQSEKDPKEAPMDTLRSALHALECNQYDLYLSHVDYGRTLDASQEDMMRIVLKQNNERLMAEHGMVHHIDMLDICYTSGDSLCEVFFQTTYSDSTKILDSQQMRKVSGEWKLRPVM